jgi:FkbM family methyltransferase
MDFHPRTLVNRLAKRAARPLSFVVGSALVHKPARFFDAYLNFLLGKGAGAGWDMRHEVEHALSLVYDKHPVVFDVGANVGHWCRKLLELNPQAQVFLFEPSPDCQQRLSEQKFPGTRLIPAAVGSEPGRASFHFSSEFDDSASLYARRDSYFHNQAYRTIEVEMVTIDSIIEKYEIPFVDFMKMDTEGHELFVLRGAEQALQSKRIGALAFEFGSGNVNSRTFFRDFWELLTAHGFSIARLAPSGKALPLSDYYEDCEYFRGATNYVA